MPVGTVKFFNTDKGYGFIQPDNGGPDAFVHISAVERAGLGELVEGQKLSYDMERDMKSGKTMTVSYIPGKGVTVSQQGGATVTVETDAKLLSDKSLAGRKVSLKRLLAGVALVSLAAVLTHLVGGRRVGSGLARLDLPAKARGLVLGIVQFRKSVRELATGDEELEPVGHQRVGVVRARQRRQRNWFDQIRRSFKGRS